MSTTVLAALKNNKAMPYLGNVLQQKSDQPLDWEKSLHPVTELEGRETYYYAVVPHPVDFVREGITSYNKFLDWSDQQGIHAVG